MSILHFIVQKIIVNLHPNFIICYYIYCHVIKQINLNVLHSTSAIFRRFESFVLLMAVDKWVSDWSVFFTFKFHSFMGYLPTLYHLEYLYVKRLFNDRYFNDNNEWVDFNLLSSHQYKMLKLLQRGKFWVCVCCAVFSQH